MKKFSQLPLILFLLVATGTFFLTSQAQASDEWAGDISLGYNVSNGNTENSSLSMSGHVKRMFDKAEFMLKGDIYTSSTDNRLDDQKWSGLIQTTFDIDEEGLWFASFSLLTDHDRSADIDVRITPSAGIGYWIAQEEGWKWNVEAQLGYETTNYRTEGKDSTSEAVALGKTYLEKTVFEKAQISESFTIIPSLESGGGYRIKSETEFTNPLREDWDLSIKYVLDFDSEPSDDKKKTDTRLVTGIKYRF